MDDKLKMFLEELLYEKCFSNSYIFEKYKNEVLPYRKYAMARIPIEIIPSYLTYDDILSILANKFIVDYALYRSIGTNVS